MGLLDFKFLPRLLSPAPVNAPIADGDRLDVALDKLQGQVSAAGRIKSTEVNVGDEFVGDAEFFVTEPGMTAESIVIATVLGVQPSDGRDVDEIYAEGVICFAIAGADGFKLRLLPQFGSFNGRYVVGYQVSK